MMRSKSGEELAVDRQVHLYTQNSLMGHPLVSPALSYLGGLPPLLFIVSDKEVLRDEDVYAAHKAAYPERFPVRQETKDLYPPLKDIEKRCGRTQVHLQVYDDTAHILPILFPFTTPAKFCFRTIATFCKYVTGIPLAPSEQLSPSPGSTQFAEAPVAEDTPRSPGTLSKRSSIIGRARTTIRNASLSSRKGSLPRTRSESRIRKKGSAVDIPPSPARPAFVPPLSPPAPTPLSAEPKSMLDGPVVPSPLPSPALLPPESARNGELFPATQKTEKQRTTEKQPSAASSDVGGARFHHSTPTAPIQGERYAGNPSVYGCMSRTEQDSPALGTWDGEMIRERVSTSGVVRPLEPEDELPAFHLKPEAVGQITELTVRRFIDGKARYGKKYERAVKGIERERKRLLERARKQALAAAPPPQTPGMPDALPSWGWGWVLDQERPPPSCVAARRDTEEAMRLARIADEGVFQREHLLSGNNLWSVVVNFLTVGPERGEVPKAADTHRVGDAHKVGGPHKTGNTHGTGDTDKIGDASGANGDARRHEEGDKTRRLSEGVKEQTVPPADGSLACRRRGDSNDTRRSRFSLFHRERQARERPQTAS